MYIVYKMGDLDISASDMDRRAALIEDTCMETVDTMTGEMWSWSFSLAQELKCEQDKLTIAGAYNKQAVTKDKLISSLASAFKHLDKYQRMLANFKELRALEQSEITCSQRSVIKLQAELLNCKDEQLKSLQSTVQTTVKETVRAGIISYSDAIKKNSPSPVMSPVTLKRVVQEAIVEEDRSRNLLVFGLQEEAGECLEDKVSEVLQELGVKPRVEATRFGSESLNSKGKAMPRPIKLTVASAISARQIRLKAKNLRNVDKFRSVYIAPDRSLEERVSQKQLVVDLKKRVSDQPGLYHYIRGGKVCTAEKNGT